MKQAKFSVLDLAPIVAGSSAAQAFQNSRDLARHAELWRYTRFWVAEHHNIPGIASAATSVVIANLAQATKTIRVGSGGIMLPNHAPLLIAEQFGTLEALFPNRIDLGIGRAPGGDLHTAHAIRRGQAGGVDTFEQDLAELRTYLGPIQPDQVVRAVPGQNSNLPLYLLGSSDYSANLAAELGLPFAFASHFAPDYLTVALALYRQRFQPSETLKQPYVMVGVNIFAADTDAEAKRLFTSVQQAFLNLVRGIPVEEALAECPISQPKPELGILLRIVQQLIELMSADSHRSCKCTVSAPVPVVPAAVPKMTSSKPEAKNDAPAAAARKNAMPPALKPAASTPAAVVPPPVGKAVPSSSAPSTGLSAAPNLFQEVCRAAKAKAPAAAKAPKNVTTSAQTATSAPVAVVPPPVEKAPLSSSAPSTRVVSATIPTLSLNAAVPAGVQVSPKPESKRSPAAVAHPAAATAAAPISSLASVPASVPAAPSTETKIAAAASAPVVPSPVEKALLSSSAPSASATAVAKPSVVKDSAPAVRAPSTPAAPQKMPAPVLASTPRAVRRQRQNARKGAATEDIVADYARRVLVNGMPLEHKHDFFVVQQLELLKSRGLSLTACIDKLQVRGENFMRQGPLCLERIRVAYMAVNAEQALSNLLAHRLRLDKLAAQLVVIPSELAAESDSGSDSESD